MSPHFLVRPAPPATGGGKRIRTDDPLLAKQVLYQLSYTPVRRRAVLPIPFECAFPHLQNHIVLKINPNRTPRHAA